MLISYLKKRGVRIISSLKEVKKGTVVITRSHGITKEEMESLRKKDVVLYDGTCHCVYTTQKLIKNLSQQKVPIFLLGDERHPEIRCLKSYGNGHVVVLPDIKSVDDLHALERAFAICKNTENEETFSSFVSRLQRKVSNLTHFKTICPEILQQRESAKRILKLVDVLVVIGSKRSHNTLKTVEEMAKITPTYLVEDEAEISRINFTKIKSVGLITAVSVPPFLLENILKMLRDLG